MNLLIWNCRDSHNAEFRRHFSFLLDNHRPVLAVFLETHMQDHSILRDDFQFTNMFQVAANGLIGGLVVLCNNNLINVEELRMSEQEVHCLVQVWPNSSKSLFSAIYASNSFQYRNILWENVLHIYDTYKGP